jgi:uncharacterized protein YlxW (UPF0749 family)
MKTNQHIRGPSKARVTAGAKHNRTTAWFLLGPILILLSMIVSIPTSGAPQDQSGHQMKVPETARDHRELAEHYQKQAAELRAEVKTHEQMLTEFNRGVAKDSKSGENPYSRKMRLHCEKYIKAAENLEQEAVESARFHELRAKELEGN